MCVYVCVEAICHILPSLYLSTTFIQKVQNSSFHRQCNYGVLILLVAGHGKLAGTSAVLFFGAIRFCGTSTITAIGSGYKESTTNANTDTANDVLKT